MDYPLLVAVLLLVASGLVMVYSTSFYNMIVANRSPDTFLVSSIRYAVIGTVVMLVVSQFNYRMYRKLAIPLYLITIVLSIVVLFFGKTVKGGTRWLTIPVLDISFMPSELAKISIIILFAWLIAMAGSRIREFKHFLVLTLLVAVISGLTILQRDLSTTAIIMALSMMILFVGGCNWRYIAGLGVAGVAAAAFYIVQKEYSRLRIAIWLDGLFDRVYAFSDDKYQIIYSIYAVGAGGLKGKGLGMSELKLLRLPDAYNDFIFAIICEEFGFWGALLVLLFFAFIVYRIFLIALKTEDVFGSMIAAGTAILIAMQVVINVGVVTNLLPTTGITLPFISKGGTSLVIMMFLVGVVLNISLQPNQTGRYVAQYDRYER